MNKKNWFDPLMNDDVIFFFADVIKKMKIRYMKNGLIHYYQLYLEIIFCWFGKKYRTGNSKKNFLAKFLLLVTSFRWRHFKKKRTSNLTSWRHITIFWRRQFFLFYHEEYMVQVWRWYCLWFMNYVSLHLWDFGPEFSIFLYLLLQYGYFQTTGSNNSLQTLFKFSL